MLVKANANASSLATRALVENEFEASETETQ
jgi:hypothetical protein